MTEETIQDDGSPRKYFGAIPHMAGAKLDVYEHRLYAHYIEVCGLSKTDTCTQAERTIYTTCGMSKQRFLKARKGLVGKKFITFRPGKPNKKGQKGYAARTTIIDIWEENIKFCKSRPYTGQILPVEGVNNYPLKGSDITRNKKYKNNKEHKDLSPPESGDDSTPPLDGIHDDEILARQIIRDTDVAVTYQLVDEHCMECGCTSKVSAYACGDKMICTPCYKRIHDIVVRWQREPSLDDDSGHGKCVVCDGKSGERVNPGCNVCDTCFLYLPDLEYRHDDNKRGICLICNDNITGSSILDYPLICPQCWLAEVEVQRTAAPPPLDGVIIDTKICRICGQSMPEWAECTRCATIPLDADSGHDATFCDDCGGLLTGGAPDNTYIHCICDNGRAQYVRQDCGCVWYMVDGKHDESRSTYCDEHVSAINHPLLDFDSKLTHEEIQHAANLAAELESDEHASKSKRNGGKYGACDGCGRFVYDGDCRHCEKDTIVSNLGADNTPVAVEDDSTYRTDCAFVGKCHTMDVAGCSDYCDEFMTQEDVIINQKLSVIGHCDCGWNGDGLCPDCQKVAGTLDVQDSGAITNVATSQQKADKPKAAKKPRKAKAKPKKEKHPLYDDMTAAIKTAFNVKDEHLDNSHFGRIGKVANGLLDVQAKPFMIKRFYQWCKKEFDSKTLNYEILTKWYAHWRAEMGDNVPDELPEQDTPAYVPDDTIVQENGMTEAEMVAEIKRINADLAIKMCPSKMEELENEQAATKQNNAD